MSELIFMLTRHSATLRELTHAIQADGRRAVFEVVAPDRDRELAAIHTGLELGVDLLMGGVHVGDALPLIGTGQVEYLPRELATLLTLAAAA